MSDLPTLRESLEQHGLMAKKAFGQHFLLDLNVTRKIVRLGGPFDGDTVIEVGPGPGGLTRAVLETEAAHLIAVEKDARFIELLEELKTPYGERFEVIEADALKVDLARLGPAPRRIVANLPYNISTVLLLGWLDRIDDFAALTLMFQKEVAERLVARPRTKDYGRLSIVSQWRCTVKQLFDIPPKAFIPPPKVTSTVVHLVPHPAPLYPADPRDLEAVAEAGFGQRRKMLRQSLKTLPVEANALLDRANIRDTARAEELSIEEFCRLARAFGEMRRRGRSG